ncbi:hypothetical protein FUA23_16640 [Neolewinella aurantiaca]|uniref:CRISPR type III-associated protein domain-containing protein n=1 Tax=Neolewinella aurantiaca TaxID=2602767 RepID=A0A5C7FNL7_9BACT|nr:RAMP superfamily CRISPR-associated protein [Neolewinella aurantiaca]TXF87987.1 hypothetical protein FUA23_16640 [Neolewinella aurantiaca]
MTNNTYELYVLTQTPLHIGGEQEKHWDKGFDYFEEGIDNGPTTIWKVNERKVIERIGLDYYVQALEKGPAGFKEVLRQRGLRKYPDYCGKVGEIEGSGMQLHRMIAEGKTGFPYLPGTSLKGGIRSALFKAFGGSIAQNNDRDVFGQFANSIMRFVQVSDVYFDHPGKLYNSRVYNGHLDRRSERWEGRWKYRSGSGNNENDFQNDGFATTLQTVPPGQVGKLRLRLRSSDLAQYRQAAKEEQRKIDQGISRQNKRTIRSVPAKATQLLTTPSPLEYFFTALYEYTSEYLQREIDFFTELEGDKSDLILKELKRLQAVNSANSPLLRLGYGSGFHAVTGDYQVENHLSTLSIPLKFKKKRRGEEIIEEKRMKSRRLAFDWDEQKEDYRFYLLGFIQLLTPEAAAPHLKRQQKERQQKQATIINKPVTQEVSSAKLPAGTSTPDAKPKLVQKTVKQLKRGVKVLAIVKNTRGNKVIVAPQLEGHNNTNLEISYPAGVATGKIVEITVMLQGKKIIAQRGLKIIK